MHRHALLIHISNTRLDVDEFCGQRPIVSSRSLNEPSLVRHVICRVESFSFSRDQVQIGFREVVRVNINRLHSVGGCGQWWCAACESTTGTTYSGAGCRSQSCL